jgi:hypothetical protein
LTCGGSGLFEVGFNGFAGAEKHFVGRLAFLRRVRHDFVVLVDIKVGPLS